MINIWTQEEDEKLRKIWESDLPIGSMKYLLPNRTDAAIRRRSRKIKCRNRKPGPYPKTQQMIILFLESVGSATSNMIADELKTCSASIDCYLRKLRKQKFIYISGHIKKNNRSVIRVYSLGNKSDDPRPETIREKIIKKRKEKQDTKKTRSTKWDGCLQESVKKDELMCAFYGLRG